MQMWLTYTLGVSLLPLLGWLIWRWNEVRYIVPVKAKCSSFGLKIPPGHLGLPIIGETLNFLWYFNFLRCPDDFITSRIQKYGENVGLYRTHLFGSPSIIACSPSACKQILNSTTEFKQEWPTREVQGLNSVITLDGLRHNVIKGFIVNAVKRPDALARTVVQVQPSIVAALESWSGSGRISVCQQVRKVALDYMGRSMLNFESNEERDAIEKLFDGINQGFRAQPLNVPGTAYHYALQCRKKITDKLMKEVQKRKQNMKNNAMEDENASDIMDGLMQMKDEEGRQLSDIEVVDNVLSSIHLSHVAFAYAVTWAMYYLAKFPLVLDKLREENINMMKEKNDGCITFDDISKLKYTEKVQLLWIEQGYAYNVVEESIRMGNTTSFVFRKATEDIDFKGYIIPKGWKVLCWVRYLHTDPANFEDPLVFNPDRWNTRPRVGTYFPFGGGARSCPGSMLMRVKLALFLHHLSIGYKWELVNPDVKINYLSHPLPQNGLEVYFCKI